MKLNTYYPGNSIGANPIHEVNSWSKVRGLIRAYRAGKEIKPVVIDGDIGNCNLLTGTHRLAALELMELLGDDVIIDGAICYVDDLLNSKKIKRLAVEGDYQAINDLLDK